ncbi:MAG TPA: MFS transporter [Solirubrobacteraceae bacterium]|jgi:predicted MFS family arabinose efflux permease|nr:MFS transporter [Solirubrobacteraceae bacterium]
MGTLVLATVIADSALGVIDIAVTGFAKEQHKASAAGVLPATFALTALVAGAVLGARAWRASPRARLAATPAALASAPLAPAHSVAAMACLLAIAGGPFAAQWTAVYLVLDELAPARAAAEAISWISAANGAGVGLGSAIAGPIIQRSGTPAAFVRAAGLLTLASSILLLRRS